MHLRTFLLALLLPLAAASADAQAVRDEVLRNMTPQQRENLWQSMTPDQRAEFWRRLTPEQRQAIRQQMPPEQREAMRQRMMEQRERGGLPPGGPPGERFFPPGAPAGDGAAPPPHGGHGFGPRRLSPEERQKLREQVIESTRDLREDRRPRMGMERRRGRDR